MLFRTQIIFCSSELRLHFRITEVGSLLSLNRAWRAQVTFGTRSGVFHYIIMLLSTVGYIFLGDHRSHLVLHKWGIY